MPMESRTFEGPSAMDAIDGPRAAMPGETDAINRLVTDIFGTSDMAADQVTNEYPLIFRDPNDESRRIICIEGKPVAYVGIHFRSAIFFGCEISVGSIGGVCTDENYRNRGLASILMNDAESLMRTAGVDLVIVSGERGLYRRLNYEFAGSVRTYRIPPASTSTSSGNVVRAATEKDLPELARLYQQLPVRFRRSREDFRIAMGAIWMDRKIDDRQALVMERSGVLDSYLTYTRDHSAAEVVVSNGIANEIAGSAAAILALANEVAQRAGAAHFSLAVGGAYGELIRECDRRGYPCEIGPQPGTFKLFDTSTFLAKMKPYLIGRADEDSVRRLIISSMDGIHFLGDGNERYRIGRDADLLAMIFEPGLPSGTGPKGRLGETVAACLPLPMVWTGLNFV